MKIAIFSETVKFLRAYDLGTFQSSLGHISCSNIQHFLIRNDIGNFDGLWDVERRSCNDAVILPFKTWIQKLCDKVPSQVASTDYILDLVKKVTQFYDKKHERSERCWDSIRSHVTVAMDTGRSQYGGRHRWLIWFLTHFCIFIRFIVCYSSVFFSFNACSLYFK